MPGRATVELCPCCGCVPARTTASRDHESFDVYTLAHCPGCGSAWVLDPPRAEDLGAHYQSHAGEAMHRPPLGLVRRARGIAMRRELRPLLTRLQHGSRILDLGAGDGSLCDVLVDSGFTALASDIYGPDQWHSSVPYFQTTPDCELPETGEPIDAVTMRHVLEHLPDPLRTLTAIAGQGCTYCFIVVPNRGSRWADRLGDDWYYWDPPRHLTHFTKAGLQSVAERSGWRVAELSTKGIDELVTSLHRRNRLSSGMPALTALTTPTGPLAALSSAISAPFGHGVLCGLLVNE